ncbi:MAG TPA: cation transporter [Verrucomicrobiae bacterium]|nr:cation transporter [Verrucomicrobiae bacterium]
MVTGKSLDHSPTAEIPGAGSAETEYRLIQRGRRLEYLSIGWTCVEAVAAFVCGYFAASVSLIGFGVDSGIEVFSSLVLLWRLAQDEDKAERERTALRLVGLSFFALSAYIAFGAAQDLLTRQAPRVSYVGMGFLALAIVVMQLLARAKRRVAAGLNSRALQADSRQSSFCAYLSAIALAGLTLNAWLGWWWADPVAALGMIFIIVPEGIGAFRGNPCECCG